MRKLLTLCAILISLVPAYSQKASITLTFIAEDSVTHNPVGVESVFIHNLTAGCDTVIYGGGDEPFILLTYPSGLSDPGRIGGEPVILLSLFPNPYAGKSHATIRVNKPGNVKLGLTDFQGRLLTFREEELAAGVHKYEINTSVQGLLILNVSAGGYSVATKLINSGPGEVKNEFVPLGKGPENMKTREESSAFIFRPGDQLWFRSVIMSYYDDIIYDSPARDTTYKFITARIPVPPEIISDTVTAITSVSATAGGVVTSDGGSPVTSRGFCWSTEYYATLQDPHTNDGSGTGAFISHLDSLSPNTKYFGRAYAINSVDTAYGLNVEFSTLIGPPGVLTLEVTNVGATSATGKGDVLTDGGDTVSAKGFCWARSLNPTIQDPHTVSGSGIGPFESQLTGLSPHLTYHARAYAINSADTSYGDDVEFLTLATSPAVVTVKVFDITPVGVTSWGEVTGDGGDAVIARGFCWSTSPDPDTSDQHIANGSGIGPYQSNITGLSPDIRYYLKAFAVNSIGVSYGDEITFDTPGDGFYIRGGAIAYSECNDNALMKMTVNSKHPVTDSALLELYIPVREGSGGFNIVRVSGTTMTIYGPAADFVVVTNGGSSEPKVPFQRGSYAENGSKFFVPSDGMYHVAIYAITQKAVIVPVHWGVIGTATTVAWLYSIPMTESSFDLNAMDWNIEDLKLWADIWKVRYSDGWGVDIDTTVDFGGGIKGVTVNTNFGGTTDSLVPGGNDFVNTDPGLYTCNLAYTLGSGYSLTLVKTDSLPPTDWTGVVCDAVGTGISPDNPSATPDTSSWHWGYQLVGDNGGIPSVSGMLYTWTWSDIILEAYQGFKVRTLNALPPPVNGRYFDSGYTDLNVGASSPFIIDEGPPYHNLIATVKGSYSITLNIDAANLDQREIIIVKN